MSAWADTIHLVETRAESRCEYCRMHQALQGATFHIEHTVPESRGGTSEPDNLAWACPGCNLRKSDRVEAVDPETGSTVPLFNPRKERREDHFRLEGYCLIGRSPKGRATIKLLDLNHPRRQLIRQAEELFGLFPP